METNNEWTDHPVIGYVPLDKHGQPYRPVLGRASWQRRKPVTIYKTMGKAQQYSPVSKASEVRMFVELEVS